MIEDAKVQLCARNILKPVGKVDQTAHLEVLALGD